MAEGGNFFHNEGPNLDEILLDLQNQLNKENEQIQDLEAKADALKNREEQLRMEFRKAESRKTAKSAEFAAKKGTVKKKETMYLEHRGQFDKMMKDCHQLELNADKLKIENKSATEGTTLSLLNICKEEKDNCQFVLCGNENADKMLSHMNTEIDRLSSNVRLAGEKGRAIGNHADNELNDDCALVEYQVASLQKEIDTMDGKIATRRCEAHSIMKTARLNEHEEIKQNITLTNKKIAELQHKIKD